MSKVKVTRKNRKNTIVLLDVVEYKKTDLILSVLGVVGFMVAAYTLMMLCVRFITYYSTNMV